VAAIAAITGPHRIDLLSLLSRTAPRHLPSTPSSSPSASPGSSGRHRGATLSTAGAVFQGLLRTPLPTPTFSGFRRGRRGSRPRHHRRAGLSSLRHPVLASWALSSPSCSSSAWPAEAGIPVRNAPALGVIVNAFCNGGHHVLILHGLGNAPARDHVLAHGDLGARRHQPDPPGGRLPCWREFIVIYLHARGPEPARSSARNRPLQLGVDVEKTRRVLFFAASFITAGAGVALGAHRFRGASSCLTSSRMNLRLGLPAAAAGELPVRRDLPRGRRHAGPHGSRPETSFPWG